MFTFIDSRGRRVLSRQRKQITSKIVKEQRIAFAASEIIYIYNSFTIQNFDNQSYLNKIYSLSQLKKTTSLKIQRREGTCLPVLWLGSWSRLCNCPCHHSAATLITTTAGQTEHSKNGLRIQFRRQAAKTEKEITEWVGAACGQTA